MDSRKQIPSPALTRIERRLGAPGLFREIKIALGGAFGKRLQGIVLYGSQAQGKARADSDLDLLVVVRPQKKKPYVSELLAAHEALADLQITSPAHISVQFAAPGDYRSPRTSYHRSAVRDGIPL